MQKTTETFKWETMDPSQYVSELLMAVLNGWKKVYPHYFAEDSPLLAKFPETHWGPMQLLSPVVKLNDAAATPRWTSPPVPHCHFNRNISWL